MSMSKPFGQCGNGKPVIPHICRRINPRFRWGVHFRQVIMHQNLVVIEKQETGNTEAGNTGGRKHRGTVLLCVQMSGMIEFESVNQCPLTQVNRPPVLSPCVIQLIHLLTKSLAKSPRNSEVLMFVLTFSY